MRDQQSGCDGRDLLAESDEFEEVGEGRGWRGRSVSTQGGKTDIYAAGLGVHGALRVGEEGGKLGTFM